MNRQVPKSVEKAIMAVEVHKTVPAKSETENRSKTPPKPKKICGFPVDSEDLNDATKFKKFVEANKLATEFDGKTYLLAEAWQYIVALKNLFIETVVDTHRTPEIVRVTVKATLKEGSSVVSEGVMQASSEEKWLKDKSAYAVYGLAQTRAISRAVRNRFGYLARACGFEAVPFEEIYSGEKK